VAGERADGLVIGEACRAHEVVAVEALGSHGLFEAEVVSGAAAGGAAVGAALVADCGRGAVEVGVVGGVVSWLLGGRADQLVFLAEVAFELVQFHGWVWGIWILTKKN